MQRIYACIDLKSFYASVECAERGLDPFKTNLVVADPSRGSGSVCLAITPKMKTLGVKNRCRVFEIPKNIDYITAKPRMKLYMEKSAEIYSIYLKYISPDDIHVYSIDECFFDLTDYLKLYNLSAKELTLKMMQDVLKTTKIPSSAGIGTNLFLAKIALDITAKKSAEGIGILDEESFKKTLWHHTPLEDFWNIGKGITKRLNRLAMYDLYDVAHADEKILYKEFGVNAEFLIDHAWGREPCTIKEIKEYVPKAHSLSNGQVLFEDYSFDDAKTVLYEMIDMQTNEMAAKGLFASGVSLNVRYSKEVISSTGGSRRYKGAKLLPSELKSELIKLFEETTNKNYPIRKINIGFIGVTNSSQPQLSFFEDENAKIKELDREKAVSQIKSKYGKNAILRGVSLKEKATAKARNSLIGGHNAE